MRLKANKYARWYRSIVTNPDASATYTETHHIVPMSMGGLDEASNRVCLSARQHFVAHLLLTKAVPRKWLPQAWAALRAMALMRLPGRDFTVTSRLYEKLRKIHAEATSKRMKLLWQTHEHRHKMLASRSTEQRRADALKAIAKPEVKAKREAAYARRGPHKPETIEEMKATYAHKNGLARKYLPPKPKRWAITAPDGQTFSCSMLEDFCREKSLHYPSLRASNGLPIPPLQRITSITNPARQHTTGWSAIK